MDSFFDIFIDPPVDTVAHHPDVVLGIGIAMFVVAAVVGVVYTLRTRSPLFFWSAVAGATLLPFVVEPFGDHILGMWYPTNLDIVATSFDRPVPWFVVLFYASFTPLVVTAAHYLVQRRVGPTRLLAFVAILAVLELPMEILGGHWNWMNYYGNHALVFGVPIYCFVQNTGWVVIMAWLMAKQLPHTYGWRWILVPFTVALSLPVFALITTWPAYVAIATEAGPALGWSAGILATILNAAVVVACAYSKPLSPTRPATPEPGSLDEQTAVGAA